MANAYRILDFDNWKRKEYYLIYKNAVQPQYCVSFELDVSNFRKYTKRKNLSFTMAFIFAVTTCANEIEEFRYRFLDGGVVLYDAVDTAFTYLDRETELFKFVTVPMQDTVEEYAELAEKTAKSQTRPFTGPVDNDVYQFSALPWISFTHISHTDFGDRENAQPLFDWGKYREKDGRLMMPFAVQVHHGFVDGLHIAKLADRLQRYIDKVKE